MRELFLWTCTWDVSRGATRETDVMASEELQTKAYLLIQWLVGTLNLPN